MGRSHAKLLPLLLLFLIDADDELLIHRPAIRVDNRTSSSSAMDHQLFCLSQGYSKRSDARADVCDVSLPFTLLLLPS